MRRRRTVISRATCFKEWVMGFMKGWRETVSLRRAMPLEGFTGSK